MRDNAVAKQKNRTSPGQKRKLWQAIEIWNPIHYQYKRNPPYGSRTVNKRAVQYADPMQEIMDNGSG